jgi:uncharacterized protein
VWLVASRYNFRVPIGDGDLLYNANSGAVLKLSGPDAEAVSRTLCGPVTGYGPDSLPDDLRESLQSGGFLVPSGTDEVQGIRERYLEARGVTPFVVTLTTTMNCNLGCYYCYESRTGEQLESDDVGALERWVGDRLRSRRDRSLHVDWYGGEPLLNLEFIDAASIALQEVAQRETARYSASVISNGTAWPVDVGAFVAAHKVRQVQISFDGLQDNHDSRRRYRKDFAPGPDASSFEAAVRLVDQLLDFVRVDVRFNIDRRNQADLMPFVEMADRRGWFSRKFRAVIQPARLASYSDRSAFMRRYELTATEFDTIRGELRTAVRGRAPIEESEVPDGFPVPRTSVCAALARDSFVAGADGLHYRCGLQVGEKHRAVGAWAQRALPANPANFPDAAWWDAFEPTAQPTCSRCSFLPICWGGCPKRHLEGDRHALDEQGAYWRTNLARLVAARFGVEPLSGFVYGQSDQFRV